MATSPCDDNYHCCAYICLHKQAYALHFLMPMTAHPYCCFTFLLIFLLALKPKGLSIFEVYPMIANHLKKAAMAAATLGVFCIYSC